MSKTKPPLDPFRAHEAFKLVERMVEAKQPWMPYEIVGELLRWVVLPDDLTPGQAAHNVALLFDRSQEIAREELNRMSINFAKAPGAHLTYLQVTKRDLEIFTALVREQARNEQRNKEQPE